MYYIVRDVTGAAITYERVGKAFFEEGAANCMAKEISKKGGQPLRVVNSAEYREIVARQSSLFHPDSIIRRCN